MNGESGRVLSALLMFRRFERALRHALLEENFAAILGSAVTLIVVGTLAYTFGEDWSLVDGFYFAVATLTTLVDRRPQSLVITNSWLKVFTIFYILIGIGILVEVARQLGVALIHVQREEPRSEGHRESSEAPSRQRLIGVPRSPRKLLRAVVARLLGCSAEGLAARARGR